MSTSTLSCQIIASSSPIIQLKVRNTNPSVQSLLQTLPQKPADSYWTLEDEKLVTAPYAYLSRSPGKNIRRRLIDAFNCWFGVPAEKVDTINNVVKILHNASLIIDDIEDSSPLRRGEPAAHEVYGVPQALNCGNYMFFLALQELLKLDAGQQVIQIFTEELMNLHRGQGMELYWRESGTVPKTEDYLKMVANKTGGLFRLAVRLLHACRDAKSAADDIRSTEHLANLLGILFQIRDDYLNLQAKEYSDAKGFAEDLTEGKYSFIVINALAVDPGNRFLPEMLKARPTAVATKLRIIEYLEDMGTFRYTREVLGGIDQAILEIVAQQGGNAAIEGLVRMMRVA